MKLRFFLRILTIIGMIIAVLVIYEHVRSTMKAQLTQTLETLNTRSPAALNKEIPKPTQDPNFKTFACGDLYRRLCASTSRRDATGRVPASYEGEAGVLRIFKKIFQKHPNLSPTQIDELVAKEIYTPKRTAALYSLFDDIRETIIDIFTRQKSMTAEHVQKLSEILMQVKLELPPPASVYADEPDLLTLDNAYYYRTKEGAQKVRIGGAQVYSVTSRYNLIFTLAHELAHAISPCDIEQLHLAIPIYQNFISCIGRTEQDVIASCNRASKLPEIFSDWIATHVVADLIHDDDKRLSPKQKRLAVFNSIRDVCPDDMDEEAEEDEAEEAQDGLDAIHPKTEYRINGILGKHPEIQKMVGCQMSQKENQYGIPSQCYLQ